jgi:hypothetical protein
MSIVITKATSAGTFLAAVVNHRGALPEGRFVRVFAEFPVFPLFEGDKGALSNDEDDCSSSPSPVDAAGGSPSDDALRVLLLLLQDTITIIDRHTATQVLIAVLLCVPFGTDHECHGHIVDARDTGKSKPESKSRGTREV